MNNYKNAFTEVHTILDCLDEEELSKIPPEVLEVISEIMNEEYYYEIDEEIELREQPMLPETKAILFNLFRDYLSTPEQKEKIIKMQKEERQKNEIKKQQKYNTDIFSDNKKNVTETVEQLEKEKYEKYNPDNIFKNRKQNTIVEENITNATEMIEYKESIFKKIINKIKGIFKR